MEWVGGWTPPQEKSKASFFLPPLQRYKPPDQPIHMCPTHVRCGKGEWALQSSVQSRAHAFMGALGETVQPDATIGDLKGYAFPSENRQMGAPGSHRIRAPFR